MIEWKPIISAPLDGRFILVCDNTVDPKLFEYTVYKARWDYLVRNKNVYAWHTDSGKVAKATHWAEIGERPI